MSLEDVVLAVHVPVVEVFLELDREPVSERTLVRVVGEEMAIQNAQLSERGLHAEPDLSVLCAVLCVARHLGHGRFWKRKREARTIAPFRGRVHPFPDHAES